MTARTSTTRDPGHRGAMPQCAPKVHARAGGGNGGASTKRDERTAGLVRDELSDRLTALGLRYDGRRVLGPDMFEKLYRERD